MIHLVVAIAEFFVILREQIAWVALALAVAGGSVTAAAMILAGLVARRRVPEAAS